MNKRKSRSLRLFLISVFAIIVSANIGRTQELPVQPDEEKDSDIEITDKMIGQFVGVTAELNAIQKDGQLEMMDAIAHQGLTVDRFNAINNMEEYPDDEETKAISRVDKIAFDNAKKQVDQIQLAVEQRMDEAILRSGLNLEEYQAISRAYKEDDQVQKRVDQKTNSKP